MNSNRFIKLIKDNSKNINDIDKLIDDLKLCEIESIDIQDAYENFKLNFGKHKDKTLSYIWKNDKKYLLWLSKELKKNEKSTLGQKIIYVYVLALDV